MKLRICLTLIAIGLAAPAWAVGGVAHNLPPSARLMEPGPGVGGPGPGVIAPGEYGPPAGGGVMPTQFAGGGYCAPGGGAGSVSQIAFIGVAGGEITWDVGGQGMFDSPALVMPGRQNFGQGAIYRLKLTNLPQRPGVELYPTLEVGPVTPRTDAFLSHAPIPVQFTDEDLDQVLAGNFVTKVIYLPDPEYQDLAIPVETLVSTRLDPGVDPIAEADHRGSILAIVRIGSLDLQLPGQMTAMNNDGVQPAQYTEGMNPANCGPGYGSAGYGNTGYGGPQGMPTAGFAPQVTPPNVVSGVNGPQYGMPYVGTPIGLPGPPHIPLGHPAGLVKHKMHNKTRTMLPPPVHKQNITVKQRPGMNYPRPVNHVRVDETNRAGLRLFGGLPPSPLKAAMQNLSNKFGSHRDGCTCQECR